MNNEIGRKITSLTLMTIMIAGGMTFAMPSVMPAAYAQSNANLFVSVEESVISDRFGGPMVVEVIVNDPDLKEIDEAESEPDVEVNGKNLKRPKADDGNWYGYFADRTKALTADGLAFTAGTSLDFGSGCTAASASAIGGVSYSDTVGVFFADAPAVAGAGLFACAGVFGGFVDIQNVIRENKTLNDNVLAGGIGQLGYTMWPVIQLYDFTAGGDAIIKYNIGGGSPQISTIEFDNSLDDHPKSGGTLDRSDGKYPRGASVHGTLNDVLLNIDPTDEDSWTFGSNATNSSTFYQVFNEDGGHALDLAPVDGNPDTAPFNVQPFLASLDYGDLGVLKVNPDKDTSGTFVLNVRDNDNTNVTNVGDANDATTPFVLSSVLGGTSVPLTFTETESSSGILENTDEGDISDLFVTRNAKRGTTATIDYNDKAKSIIATLYFGSLDLDASALGGEWNSGEEITISLDDKDLNLNSKSDEDILLSDAAFPLIPSLQIGNPITLEDAAKGALVPGFSTGSGPAVDVETLNVGGDYEVQAFSKRANIGIGPGGAVTEATGAPIGNILTFSFPDTMTDFNAFVFNGSASQGGFGGKFAMLNYDLRTFEDTFTDTVAPATSINITIADDTGGHIGGANATSGRTTAGGSIAAGCTVAPFCGSNGLNDPIAGLTATDFQGLVDITNADLAVFDSGADTLNVILNITGDGGANPLAVGNYTTVVDFFNFGQSGDGVKPSERFNNAIYRLELEESGDNTGTFTGSVEYLMLNQINVNQSSTYVTSIDPITDAIEIIVHEDLTDEDSPRINYLDLGADGVSTQIADQQEAPTHSGVVSFDSSTYKVADTVTITLEDADLNTDVETIEVFTIVTTNVLLAPDDAFDQIGKANYGQNTAGENFGRVLDVTFNDDRWRSGTDVNGGFCGAPGIPDDGLGATGFTLKETGADTGILTGDFQVPASYCEESSGDLKSVTGTDIEVNYVDYRDASGEIIEVGDGAGIRANTGSVSLDRTVYPVPWGNLVDVKGTTSESEGGGFSIFPIHSTVIYGDVTAVGEILSGGDLAVHIRVNDPDFDISASGEDQIATLLDTDKDDTTIDEIAGPVQIDITRGSAKVILATAGGPVAH